ncbi:MAG TPA: zf-HC2 domain-containing protein [Bryobacteraceae bacterium]|jgi:anti-sigma factor RsiW|nr:zf-HC2 domain-containing protein [Bryobacteraceae bacterium]
MECPENVCPQENGDAELIIAYAARTLTPEEEAAFERHLESCASCRVLVVRQRAVWSALDELNPLPVSDNFNAKLYQRIAEEQQAGWWRRLIQADWSWRPAMRAAAACAILIVAFLVKDSGPLVAPPQQPAQPKLQIEQVESALDDMDMLKQVGGESTLEKSTPRERI